jgi:hypothetical protein
MKDLEILKRLLQEADEDQIEDQDQEQEAPKPGSFEEDPMSFILKKYSSLNEIMSELMTKDFKEFVDGIFIMAPKPTTFKIQLHNGQYFFLTFMKENVYEATIQGKRYYLAGIGEKERCMVGIARLLRFGTPLKTKGPEGAEESTRDNTGMEGDWAEKTGNVAAGGEEEAGIEPAGEGGEEELAENRRILEAIIKKFAGDPEFFNIVLNVVTAIDSTAKRKTDGGLHIRANIGGPEEATKNIEKALTKAKINSADYKIEVIAPKTPGSLSGSYTTYKITAKKNISPDIKKGDTIYVVSTVKAGSSGKPTSTITQKALTPVNLGLAGDYTNVDDLIASINKAIKSQHPKLSPLISSLIDDVKGATSQQKNGLSELATVKKSIPYSDKTKKLIQQYSTSDASIIGKDFGELLGGIFLAKLVGINDKLSFPKGNEPLVDFYLDGYKISSKYDKGAAASMTDLIKNIKPDQLKKGSKELKFYNTMKPFASKEITGPDAFLNVAKIESKNMPGIATLAKILGVDVNSVTRQKINDYIVKIIDKAGGQKASNEKKDAALMKAFGKFYEVIGRSPKGGKVDWQEIKPDSYYGTVTSPFSYYVKDQLNKVEEYKDMLKDLVSKTEVKQMYLLFSGKQNSIDFTIKSFNDPNANFEFEIPSISVYNPTASKLGFKLK